MKKSVLLAIVIGLASRVAMAADPSLCETAKPYFQIGAAVTAAQVKDPAMSELILHEFNALTAEYEFMPKFLEPQPGQFTFRRADAIAAFAEEHHLFMTGHMLCWHQGTPKGMFTDADGKPLTRELALGHLKLYIDTVIKHFHGQVNGWVVVNEAISDKPDEWLRDTPAHRAIGDDYLVKVFQFAHDADPNAELYYNDYNIEEPRKLAKAIKLIAMLQEKKVRLDAVGIQGHWALKYPGIDVIDNGITAIGKTGVKVMVTELDVDVLPRSSQGADLNATEKQGADPYKAGIPSQVLDEQARRYSDLFSLFKKHHDVITRVTFWGVDDKQSWLNNFPVKGRTNYPLLFDRQQHAKPALAAVIDALTK